MDQLVNHLDKLYNMSAGKSQPKVIIRVAVGTEIPVDPQDQHRGDFSEACRKMLRSVDVVQLKQPADIVPAYQHAYRGAGSTILVEYPDYGK
jgi:pyruvate/2-oxoglutarate/acetoin dehydrogenase E1 component